MSRSWWLKTIFLIFLVLASVAILTPTMVEMVFYREPISAVDVDTTNGEHVRDPKLPEWYEALPQRLKSKTLALGLDLQGGLLLNYSVDIPSALNEKMATQAANLLDDVIKGSGSQVDYTLDRERHEATFIFDSAENVKYLTSHKAFTTEGSDKVLEIVEAVGNKVTIGLDKDWINTMTKSSVERAVETIRKRIDGLGVAQPSVRTENQTHIVVELPGLSRAGVAQAERLIATTAVLTFKLIAPDDDTKVIFQKFAQQDFAKHGIYVKNNVFRADDDPKTSPNRKTGKDKFQEFLTEIENQKIVPNDKQIVFEQLEARELNNETDDDNVDLSAQPSSWRMRVVRTDLPLLTGDHVVTSYPATDPQTQQPYVSLKLNKEGGDTFYDITKKYTGEKLAILMDSTLVSDPVIRGEIPGGNVSITMGRGTHAEILESVNNLVVSLRSGALPAPIRQESKTLVGPSLGLESIKAGTESLLIGFAAVILFMCFYYKGSGVKASFALMFNLLFILAGMASMGAVLTLPGIAGIVLTVGMAVDSNVIVFERIREELRAGETPRKSIIVGFDKALWTILDSNITTAIAAVVLMNFGSGPVKGFAVTLLLGIIATVYTAFYVTRNFFELESHYNHDSLSI